MGKHTNNLFWIGIIISVIIGWWIQNRENKKLEKKVESLEESMENNLGVD